MLIILIINDANLQPAMSNIANGRVSVKFNNSFLVQKCFYSLHSNLYFIHSL